MKIDSEFIKQIFNLKIKLKNKEDKIKLSKYEDQIPMYDIYSQQIYPINKQNIHYRLIESHYRFINNEIYQWLLNLYKKLNSDTKIKLKFKYNLDVINNYDIDTLIETSYKTLYKYSPSLGLLVSICKRNSFHPYIQHLKPYYTKLELIKLGQNMNIIKSDIDPEYLIDQEIHYSVCKSVSKNDVSFDEIKIHHQYIIDSKILSWICFYSFTGSFLFNRYLRNIIVNPIRTSRRDDSKQELKSLIDETLYNGLIKIVQSMEKSPALTNDYDIYRFIWDDSFISGLKEGDIFIDKGFVSTTRDPFYSPGLNGNFGLILLKIKIPKNKKGVGLFIENFSLFPKEEEFLLPPYSKLKLLSKNDNFKYFHTNPEFEKLINRKYEFELVDIDYKTFYLENPINQNKKQLLNSIDIDKISINGIDRVDIIKKFIQLHGLVNTNKIQLKLNNKLYSFNYQWFDSTNTSSYEKFYWNKVKDGMLFTIFDSNGYPQLNIELGSQLVINYLNSMYFNSISDDKISDDTLELIYHFGRIFYYKNAIIFHDYRSFSSFNKNYPESSNVFLSMSLFNNSIYTYLKSDTKYLESNPFINYDVGYWYLDEFFNKSLDATILDKLPDELKKSKNNKELFIECVEKYFYFYPKLIYLLDRNIFKNTYVTFNIYDKLIAEGLADNFKPNIEHTNDDAIDDTFKLIFRQPIRRL